MDDKTKAWLSALLVAGLIEACNDYEEDDDSDDE